MNLSKKQVAEMIDHTLLKPDATKNEILQLCQEAVNHNFASVCVNPCNLPLVVKELAGSSVKSCAVIGFPLGAADISAKAYEAQIAVLKGADEIDMVLNIGALKDGDYSFVMEDIMRVVDEAKTIKQATIVKVILETILLTREEKIKACLLAQKAGADFVKTSTGFSTGGATVEDIKLMKETVGTSMGIKASGGVRSLATLLAMVEAGATRIGSSSGIQIIKELDEERTA